MDPVRWHGPLKLAAWAVLGLLFAALAYAAAMALTHWSGISV